MKYKVSVIAVETAYLHVLCTAFKSITLKPFSKSYLEQNFIPILQVIDSFQSKKVTGFVPVSSLSNAFGICDDKLHCKIPAHVTDKTEIIS